jgi:branched-chain amino acid transport system ATP-binding protein
MAGAVRADPISAPERPLRHPGIIMAGLMVTEHTTRLVAQGISKAFGGVQALSDVSLTARAREILSVIGPNGAGKTTLINAITGVYPKDRGQVLLDGEDISRLRANRVARMGLARTFQNVALFRGMTVLDNLMLGRNPRMRSGALACGLYWGPARREEIAQREVVERMIDFLEITAIRRVPVGALPLGLQKRVELGRALVAEPKVLLLDEPMGGMNLEEKESMARYILDVVESSDTAVILVEHDMGVVMDISNRIMVMDQGTLLAEGTPQAIRSDPKVIAAYLGKEHAA